MATENVLPIRRQVLPDSARLLTVRIRRLQQRRLHRLATRISLLNDVCMNTDKVVYDSTLSQMEHFCFLANDEILVHASRRIAFHNKEISTINRAKDEGNSTSIESRHHIGLLHYGDCPRNATHVFGKGGTCEADVENQLFSQT